MRRQLGPTARRATPDDKREPRTASGFDIATLRVRPIVGLRRLWRAGLRLAALAGASHLVLIDKGLAAAPAEASEDFAQLIGTFGSSEWIVLGLVLGLTGFSVFSAILLLRARARLGAQSRQMKSRIQDLQSDLDRAEALLAAEPQVILSWAPGEGAAQVIGDTTLVTGQTHDRRIEAIGTWLAAEPALAVENHIEALRSVGTPFHTHANALSGHALEISGRVTGGRAVVRISEMSGLRREVAELTMMHRAAIEEATILRGLFDAMPGPAWVSRGDGRLAFVNRAYASAVDCADGNEAAARQIALLDSDERHALEQGLSQKAQFAGRMPVVVGKDRRMFDVHAVRLASGSAAMAIDISDAAAARAELGRMAQAHRRTLDQLATGVAIFDQDQRLSFYNDAYRRLWDLDSAYLDTLPGDTDILDLLRSQRRLPEDQDFRQWKQRLHEAYRAIEPREDMWHLPDGRTLRVVTTPNPEGGVTYVFENVTERLDLERRFDALIRVQRETIDNMAEGVAVFGSNGCLRLHNPSFAQMWNLPDEALKDAPHIDAVIERCRPLFADEALWQNIRAPVTGIDNRAAAAVQLERTNGTVLDCLITPLPDGATMITFQDLTDSINVERALVERNEALEQASQVKVDFVHHVSYELRSPLTTIIGFAHFLGDPATGPLTDKQQEYLNYITVSTDSLLAIINNILDLASIDAGAMTLTLSQVDIRDAIEAASKGVQDRLVKDNIALTIDVPDNIGSFDADERRVVQVLYNLLSNAAGFAPNGSSIALSAQRQDGFVTFRVRDHGPGIPADLRAKVFDWFESRANGAQHRGAGLGLSLVRSFVELHGGQVRIEAPDDGGTLVTCAFPVQVIGQRSAAE